jgi:hypothetical protein
MDAWQNEATEGRLDHYGWINEEGSLSVGEIAGIAKAVWPAVYGDPESPRPIRAL